MKKRDAEREIEHLILCCEYKELNKDPGEKAETRQFRWWLAPCEPALQWAAVVAANIDELAISTPRTPRHAHLETCIIRT